MIRGRGAGEVAGMRRSTPAAVLLAATALAAAGCGGSTPGAGRTTLTVRHVAAAPLPVAPPVRVGSAPTAVAVDGPTVWVADNADGTVVRLDAATGRRLPGRARVGAGPVAVAARDGVAWVASADGTVARLDPRTGVRTGAAARVLDPGGAALGGGALWVTSRAGDAVVRLDPATGARRGRPIRVGRGPTDVVVRDGTAWVANSASGTVSRVDTATGRASAPVRVARRQVLALAADARGVWAATTAGPAGQPIAIVGLDPGSGRPAPEALRVPGGIPLRLAAGGGSVWATDIGAPFASANGAIRPAGVTRIDPSRPAIAGGPIRVGATPGAIAVGAGAVWVANAGDGTVSRIRLAG